MKENFSFAVIPDIHLGRQKLRVNFWDMVLPEKNAVVGIEIEERLRKTVRLINQDSRVDFVATIGDLTNSALPDEYKKVREILDGLEKPYIPMMGNHDIWPYQLNWKTRNRLGSLKTIYNAKEPLTVKEFRKYFEDSPKVAYWWKAQHFVSNDSFHNYSTSQNGVKIILIDNVSRKSSPLGLPGAVGCSRLYRKSKKWLEDELRNATEKKAIIFSHAPLSMRLLRKLFQESLSGQIINIAGHTHKIEERRENGIIRYTLNALYSEPQFLKVFVSPNAVQFQIQSLKEK